MQEPTARIGLDAGGVAAKIVLLSPEGDPVHRDLEPCRGDTTRALIRLITRVSTQFSVRSSVRAALTGSASLDVARALSLERVNEIVATARGARAVFPQARAVIDLGGQSSRYMLLSEGEDATARVIDFSTNGLCAAGSGAFLEQQAERMELTTEQLATVALTARSGASIAGRCSVFAKSDMIHLQQKGTPSEEIAYGLCLALVRTFVSTVIGSRTLSTPLVLAGGGGANGGLVRAFREVLRLEPEQLLVSPHARFIGARGAAEFATGPAITLPDLLTSLESLSTSVDLTSTDSNLEPLDESFVSVAAQPEKPAGPHEDLQEVFLGLDVGSVSTNLVLITPEGELIHGIYLKTRGQPVEVLGEGLSEIQRLYGDRLKVLGVGSTGSGRHLAERVIGADVVHNEITAQMVSAAEVMPEVDTIFEIGGQDSKYIGVRDGQLADFEMNKICAAGTGSFLEEQAGRLGLSIIDEFARAASQGRQPAELGTRCTVFMDSELVRAQNLGASVGDLCAGLAYSVARNYLEKVVASRPIGRCIVFQGGTASNAAVVSAFGKILGRTIHVHPYNRLSGALGAALLAVRAHERERHPSAFRGFDACHSAAIESFECRQCENLCQVNRVRAGGRAVHFGDTCERFSEKDRAAPEGSRPFPELFARRDEMLSSLLDQALAAGPEEGVPIGLLRASLNLEHQLFWVTFLTRLGYRPVLAPGTSVRQLKTFTPKVPGEVCLPIKAASAQAQALLASGEVEKIFVPGVMDYTQRDGQLFHACLYNQQLADMLRASHGERIASAQFGLNDGIFGLVEPALALRGGLDRSLDQVAFALKAAQQAQVVFDQQRVALGREILDGSFDYAVVVLGKPYNTHDPFLNLGLARLLARLGIPAIPWDLLPLEGIEISDRRQTVPWHYNRQQLRAVELLRRDNRLFPILVSSYGCGPDGFAIKHLDHLLEGTPRLLLEFDEHRGEAGLQTRLEAFRDEIEVFQQHRQTHCGQPRVIPDNPLPPRGRRFLVPSIGLHSRVFAAVLRAGGWQAELLPGVDERTLRLGEEHSNGRECHPHAILIGELCRHAEDLDLREGDIFFAPCSETPCLIHQYGDSLRYVAQQAGYRIEVFDGTARNMLTVVGTANTLRLYEGLLAIDILLILSSRLNPYVTDQPGFHLLLDQAIDRIAQSLQRRETPVEPLEAGVQDLWHAPRTGTPGDRPVIGVTGDLYTRVHPIGNRGLFRDLEEMGCEVWPSPFFAQMTDLTCAIQAPRQALQGRLKNAVSTTLAWALSANSRRRLTQPLPREVREVTLEPDADQLRSLAAPYVGSQTNHMITQSVAKIVDFLNRGATGVINAAGINCMVGTAIDSAVPAIRRDHGQAPVISLFYGGSDSIAQNLRLGTFVHQVRESHQDRNRAAL